MNYLTIEHISKAYGERILFQDLTFSINKGQKVAFVAKNGTGKSTVLRIIAGIEGSDGVGVVRIHRDVQVGYLDQDPQFEAGQTIMDAAFDAENPTIEAIREYEMALLYPDQQERIQKALTRMDELKAWDFDVKIKQILAKLNITDLNQRVETLSGGQQKRLALARVLINEPDFLILDEPTNHLDLEMIEWLENYLAQSKLTLFMVTHDRYFLERVCDTIIELDQGKIFKYKGNYSYFLDQKMAREGQQFREVMRARSMFKTELEWMRKMPKARGTKAKARIESFYELKEKAHQTVTNQQLEMQIQTTRLGSKIVEFHSVSKAFGTFTILEKFIYKFKKKDRVGIVGKNGVGKTTFLNMLMGVERPDSGKVVVGSTVQFGYYTQDGMQLNEAKRVIEVVRDIAEFVPGEKGRKITASQLLERFLFSKEHQYTYVRKLSGGERRRLYLLTILMQNPNFLILDEPTNDLDIITLNVLEDFLAEFQGCLIIVSHDRYFMDKLVDHVFAFEGNGKIRDYPGNYSDYRSYLDQQEEISRKEDKPKAEKVKKQSTHYQNTGLTHEQQKELRRIENQINKLENKKTEISQKFNDPDLTVEQMTDLSKELKQLEQDIEEKEERWMELSELA